MSSSNQSMAGKVIVITGATSGIGQAAAKKLAAMGARLVMVARSRERGEAMLSRVKELSPQTGHTIHYADLSVLTESQRVGNEIAMAESRIDVLINNAGALFGKRQITADGLEKTFALNHMSYFVLTECLRENLAPDARVVNTASAAHRGARFRIENLQSGNKYRSFSAYGLSKLCNILFTRELARQFSDTGVTVNCLHPGVVASRFFDNQSGALAILSKLVLLFAITPEKGAETIVFLASSDDVNGITGKYFSKCRVKTPTAEAQNDRSAGLLWEESERLWASD